VCRADEQVGDAVAVHVAEVDDRAPELVLLVELGGEAAGGIADLLGVDDVRDLRRSGGREKDSQSRAEDDASSGGLALFSPCEWRTRGCASTVDADRSGKDARSPERVRPARANSARLLRRRRRREQRLELGRGRGPVGLQPAQLALGAGAIAEPEPRQARLKRVSTSSGRMRQRAP
jgi:hypothetical protein